MPRRLCDQFIGMEPNCHGFVRLSIFVFRRHRPDDGRAREVMCGSRVGKGKGEVEEVLPPETTIHFATRYQKCLTVYDAERYFINASAICHKPAEVLSEFCSYSMVRASVTSAAPIPHAGPSGANTARQPPNWRSDTCRARKRMAAAPRCTRLEPRMR